MNYFLTLGLSKFTQNSTHIIATLVSLVLGVLILSYFDTNTLFLTALLISIACVKPINEYIKQDELLHNKIAIDKVIGLWFALSVAPAFGVNLNEMLHIENGFLVQSLLSFLFFLYFSMTKPSLIGRIYREAKGGVGILGDDIIAGFAAGISSSAIWQGYLYILAM